MKARLYKYVCLITVLLMSGCVAKSSSEVKVVYALKDVALQDGYAFTNHQKPYYNYYLPTRVGRKTSTSLSEVFRKDGYTIVMNFKPSAVLVDSYDTKTMSEEEKKRQSEALKELVGHVTYRKEKGEVVYSGHYEMLDGQIYPYECRVIDNDDETVVIALTSKYIDGYCVVPKVYASSFAKTMVRMVSAVEIKKERVFEDFSLQEALEADEENEDMLVDTFGEEGYLIDVSNRETNTPD